MQSEITKWMDEGPGWLKYAVDTQLLGNEIGPGPALNDTAIQSLLATIRCKEQGFESLINGTVSYTGQLYWYLFFLADIGLTSDQLNLESEFQTVLHLEDNTHRFLISKEMKPNYFCISSILLTAMVKMSASVKDSLQPHLNTIMNTQRLDGGWHCAKSRGIGQKQEKSVSCLMDNLNILMLFAEYEEYVTEPKLNGAIDLILEHWYRQEEKWRPYGFGIGSEFKKLRYPAFKYGILRVLDVLSMYPYAQARSEFKGMLKYVQQRADSGKYFAGSVAKMFAGFDFAQKIVPSRWITFIITRIERRVNPLRI
ncbi:hypothetical protein ACFL6E_06765 [Candidatus Neomarinimicrobiota bacterium]